MSNEQVHWLLKVLQPERTLAAFPGAANLGEAAHAALLGLPIELYAAERRRMQAEVSDAAAELLADPAVASMVDCLPLRAGSEVLVFGDSLTSDPQSWAEILRAMLTERRGPDDIRVTIHAVAGETTTQGLVRLGAIARSRPDWVFFFFGTNDARTQGPNPTKTLVHFEETARNLAAMRDRVARETTARSLFIAPPSVNEAKVSDHPGLARFGVRFRNEDVARVATLVREVGAPSIDLFALLGSPPEPELVLGDGLHLTIAGQKRVALEVIRAWSALS